MRACNLCGSTRRTDAGIGPLQTCARCRKVYYCCLRHHVDHWGVHKASCPRPPPEPDEDDFADGATASGVVRGPAAMVSAAAAAIARGEAAATNPLSWADEADEEDPPEYEKGGPPDNKKSAAAPVPSPSRMSALSVASAPAGSSGPHPVVESNRGIEEKALALFKAGKFGEAVRGP